MSEKDEHMDIIELPDIDGPTVQLCWKQYMPTAPPFEGAMSRCDRRKDHKGPHTWEHPVAPPGWQPIATAPKMRTVLLCGITDTATGNYRTETGWWREAHKAGWVWGGTYREFHESQPTHWMPLPVPPVEPQGTT